MRLDYTWKWFDFHAKQRMQLFNFFLIVTGILASAYVSAYDKALYALGVAVCFIGFLQALAFFIFDVRNRDLTRYSEDILLKIETDELFKDYESSDTALGLVKRDRNSPEYRKMKWWIRAVESIVGLVFLVGILYSLHLVNMANNR